MTYDSLRKILSYLQDNDRLDRLDRNYARKIARETDLSRPTVWKCLNLLEEQNIVERKRDGKKKVIVPHIENNGSD